MYCRNCGAEITEGASFCAQCGEAAQTPGDEETDIVCMEKNYAVPNSRDNLDWDFLPPKYRQEFSRIRASGGLAAGSFNLIACLLSVFWLLAKGCWMAAVLWGAVVVVAYNTFAGPLDIFVLIVVMIIVGARGNRIFYHACVKNQQIAW